ncbi:MAG: rRNA maturation RNase YbeY [Candidatus Kerfeldbacteria bacterium]|nr:rRNA maturation RNase YbeY [Candidatus Kerfeldbacteria bacterium]
MSCEVRALVPLPFSANTVIRLVHAGLRRLGYSTRSTAVSVAFIDDRRMRELNARYRGQRRTTDVLSFNGTGNDLGELIVSVPQARRQSREYGTTLRDEIGLLVVHGLLHLAGFDHERPADRKRMQALEHELLSGRSLIRRAHEQA